MAADRSGGRLGHVSHSVLRASWCQAQEDQGIAGLLCHDQSRGTLAGALLACDAISEHVSRAGLGTVGGGTYPHLPGSLSPELCLVRSHVSNALSPAGRDYPGP